MAKNVTRTFITSTVNPYLLEKQPDNSFLETPLSPIVFDGIVSYDKALTTIRNEYGKKNNYTLTIKEDETLRTMSIEKFIANSTVVSK